MKKIRILLFLMTMHAYSVMGNHIVGGEIEFITLGGGLYRINVVQYFDKAQAVNPGPEPQVTVYIYRSSDDFLMSTHVLPLALQQPVQYTNEACAIETLETGRVLWSADVQIESRLYYDPEGYYIVWERCCRNETIVNIVNPLGSGMTYITEIPQLWGDNEAFVNSSPELFRPLSDYACQDQLYYIDFTGSDRDGDSLVYSLTSPLNSSATVAVPIPQPKPHFPVLFDENNGYSSTNMIPGDPGLEISSKGLLTVNPKKTGLHVFSVLVEEFREGVRIGSVQRDFQMLVLPSNQCSPPDPPDVGVEIPGNPGFQSSVDTLRYAFNEEKCFEYIVTNITMGETITLRAEGVNFDGDINDIFSVNQQFIGPAQDSLIVEICAPDCPPLGGKPFIVDLIAGDDACPLPQLDTLRLVMEVEPLPNSPPSITLFDEIVVVDQGTLVERSFEVTDADDDEVSVQMFIPGFDDVDKYGFSIEVINSEPGYLEGIFRWDANCTIYEFGEYQHFDVFIGPEDADYCDYKTEDYVYLNMNVNLPNNNLPLISIDGAPIGGLISGVDEDIEFIVNVEDNDGDFVSLKMIGDGFNPAAYGAAMPEASGGGAVSSTFTWFADCNFFVPGDENNYVFAFVADDKDFCNQVLTDTLWYPITLDQPPNNSPVIVNDGTYELEVNQRFELDILAEDEDFDFVTLSLYTGSRLPNTKSISFENATAQGEVKSTFSWTPECSLLRNDNPTTYTIYFQAHDDYCPVSSVDTVGISFTIKETRGLFDGFLPPNAFSPNGDGVNDEFTLSGNEDPFQNLPVDNCDDYFEYVSIHTRLGRPVFYSRDRHFSWDGEDLASDVYYYVIKYSSTEYKNYIQLLK